MNKVKEFFKGRVGGLILCVLEIVVGVLLLINPTAFTSGIIIGAGVLAVIIGAVHIIRYFCIPVEDAGPARLLYRGLVMVLVGAVCITQYEKFLTAFPLLTVIYALWMILLAAMKVQLMADMLRLKAGRWYMPAIAAGLAILLAVIILWNPFGAVNALWTFVAISLIAEALVELVGAFLK